MKKAIAAFALSLFFIASNSVAGEVSKEVLAKAEALFNAKCVQCHGPKASGTDKGPPLVNKIYHPNHHADITFRWAVERGVLAHHWNFGNMPKIDGVSSEEIDMLTKYIRNLQKEAGIY